MESSAYIFLDLLQLENLNQNPISYIHFYGKCAGKCISAENMHFLDQQENPRQSRWIEHLADWATLEPGDRNNPNLRMSPPKCISKAYSTLTFLYSKGPSIWNFLMFHFARVFNLFENHFRIVFSLKMWLWLGKWPYERSVYLSLRPWTCSHFLPQRQNQIL